MARITHLSNNKCILILGTVVGCLSLLWPKIFFPMIQGGIPANNQDSNIRTKVHPRMLQSKSVSKQYHQHQANFHTLNTHYTQNEHNSVGSASIGVIMTIYTTGIVLLFIYIIFKHISSDGSTTDPLDERDEYRANMDNQRSGKSSLNKYNHERGECLKGLALNYVKCKQKLDQQGIAKPVTDDDVSMAYNVLLGDMLELRDYLVDLQCSINCPQLSETQINNSDDLSEMSQDELDTDETPEYTKSSFSASDSDKTTEIKDEMDQLPSVQSQKEYQKYDEDYEKLKETDTTDLSCGTKESIDPTENANVEE